jgi:DNA-binding HxlR family transcriptional regulator
MSGSYDEYCPIARGLDLVGDRWTLLVLRELSLGELRFTDLRRFLPRIPPNVLSQRLKRLLDKDMVTVQELPPPAARNVYKLTERGEEVLPVLRALARFGMPELDRANRARCLPAERIGPVVFVPWFDEAAAWRLDVHERYDLRMGDVTQHLVSYAPGMRRDPGGTADLILEGEPWAFMRLRQGAALHDGPITVDGPKAAERNFCAVFGVT